MENINIFRLKKKQKKNKNNLSGAMMNKALYRKVDREILFFSILILFG